MGLRLRLALALALACLPVLGLAAGWSSRVEIESVHAAMEGFGRGVFDERAQRRCEADPANFPIPHPQAHIRGLGQNGPPPVDLGPRNRHLRYHVYAGDLTSRCESAPAFPKVLTDAARAGARRVTGRGMATGSAQAPLAVEYLAYRQGPENSPYAWVVVEHFTREPVGRLLSHAHVALLPTLLMMGAALVTILPMVARIRGLTARLRRCKPQNGPLLLTIKGRDEIADLARALEESHAQLEAERTTVVQREATLRQFVENTSHDLAVPITTLKGHLSQLYGERKALSAAGEASLEASMRDTEYVSNLLANLASVARLEASSEGLARTPIDLGELVDRVGLRHQAYAQQRGLELNWGHPEHEVLVLGDLTLMEQALSNLVQNAARHGSGGNHVAILVTARRETFTLSVADDGDGVPSSLIAFLEDRTFRADEARRRDPSGQGLGLAITQDILLRHQFRLGLHNRPSGGFEATIVGHRLEEPSAPEHG